MAVYIVERVFHIPTARHMIGKSFWQETLCGVYVQFRQQNLDWDWCKKCLVKSQNRTKHKSVIQIVKSIGQKRRVVRVIVMNFPPSESVIELIDKEGGHVSA